MTTKPQTSGPLYSHGSSTLGALQQVAAAAGTAIVVAVLTAGRALPPPGR